ncbi:hypothetical protein GCM10027040_07900 [Halomonas shantousis]
MAFILGNFTHPVGKRQSLPETAERIDTFQLHDAIALDELPIGKLGFQLAEFFFAKGRRIGPARCAGE